MVGSRILAPNPREFGLVSCTKDKLDEPVRPGDLYSLSAIFSKVSGYREREHNDWFMISAKYGLLDHSIFTE